MPGIAVHRGYLRKPSVAGEDLDSRPHPHCGIGCRIVAGWLSLFPLRLSGSPTQAPWHEIRMGLRCGWQAWLSLRWGGWLMLARRKVLNFDLEFPQLVKCLHVQTVQVLAPGQAQSHVGLKYKDCLAALETHGEIPRLWPFFAGAWWIAGCVQGISACGTKGNRKWPAGVVGAWWRQLAHCGNCGTSLIPLMRLDGSGRDRTGRA